MQDTDDKLFSAVMANFHHVLQHMLPDRTSHLYTLRPRRHNCSLTVLSKKTCVILLSDYCLKTCTSFNFISIFTFYCSVAFCQVIINYYDDDDDDADADDDLLVCVIVHPQDRFLCDDDGVVYRPSLAPASSRQSTSLAAIAERHVQMLCNAVF